MFTSWKIPQKWGHWSPNSFTDLMWFLSKSQEGCFVDIDEPILKFIWTCRGPRTVETLLIKSKVTLIAVAKTSKTMLNRVGTLVVRVGTLVLFLTWGEMFQFFTTEDNVCCELVIYSFYYVEVCSFCSCFLESFFLS